MKVNVSGLEQDEDGGMMTECFFFWSKLSFLNSICMCPHSKSFRLAVLQRVYFSWFHVCENVSSFRPNPQKPPGSSYQWNDSLTTLVSLNYFSLVVFHPLIVWNRQSKRERYCNVAMVMLLSSSSEIQYAWCNVSIYLDMCDHESAFLCVERAYVHTGRVHGQKQHFVWLWLLRTRCAWD